MLRSQFKRKLKKLLLESLENNYTDNYDYHMHGKEDPGRWSREWYRKNMPCTYFSKHWYINKILRKPSTHCEFLYEKLNKKEDKELLLLLVAYRQLGLKRIKLPEFDDYFKIVTEIIGDFNKIKEEKLDVDYMFALNKIDFTKFGFPVTIFSIPLTVYYEVIRDQYQYIDAGFQICQNDYIIDAGACIGDTSLFFAHRVGEKGKVFAFEMLPENLSILYRNLDMNKNLAKNISVIERPVTESSDEEFYTIKDGPASRLTTSLTESDDVTVIKSVSIDDYMGQNTISKIDLIKMDIEGAELSALKGAKKTIVKYRPKLAVCVYHKELDFDEIPKYIDSLGFGYKFYLKHHGISQGETVLYCM